MSHDDRDRANEMAPRRGTYTSHIEDFQTDSHASQRASACQTVRLDTVPFDTADADSFTSDSGSGSSVRPSGCQTDRPASTAARCDGQKCSDSCASKFGSTYQTVRQESWQRRFIQSWWFPQFVLLASQLALAVMHVTANRALEFISPMPFASLRIGIAIPFLLVFCRIQEPDFRLQRDDMPWLLGMGFFGVLVPQTGVIIGNNLAGAAYAAIFTPTVPVFTALMQAMLRQEQITLAKGVGVVLTFAGTLILLHIESLNFQSASTLGLLALLMNCSFLSVYLVLLQLRLGERPYPFSIFAGASCVGATAISLIALRDYSKMEWGVVPASAWGALLWAALGTSFLAHSGIAYAVSRCTAVVPSMYTCLQTVLTAGLSALWLGQMLTLRDMAAMVIIIGGVVFVIAAKLSENRTRQATKTQYHKVLQGDPTKPWDSKGDVEKALSRQLPRELSRDPNCNGLSRN